MRNVKLFDAVRFWAYSVPRGQDLYAWTRRVRVHALEQNRRFPEPLDESEVKQTAYSISTWCWSGGGARWHFDHSSAAQRRRGDQVGQGAAVQERGAGRCHCCGRRVRAEHEGSWRGSIGLTASGLSMKIVGRVVHRT